MIRSFRLIGALAVALLFAAVTGPAGAGDGVPLPDLAKAKGEACVEPTDVMRRSHMDFLKQQRDETMHLGIRNGKYSLNGCIECHAAPDPNGTDASIKTVDAFCEECHTYAAVKVDCWSCHNPKLVTEPKMSAATTPFDPEQDRVLALLKAHLANGSAKP
jgi:[DsrC]-trisulfide reductase subunit J